MESRILPDQRPSASGKGEVLTQVGERRPSFLGRTEAHDRNGSEVRDMPLAWVRLHRDHADARDEVSRHNGLVAGAGIFGKMTLSNVDNIERSSQTGSRSWCRVEGFPHSSGSRSERSRTRA